MRLDAAGELDLEYFGHFKPGPSSGNYGKVIRRRS
jgi:hypothetical protein